MLVLRGEFGLAKKPRSTSGCPSVNHVEDFKGFISDIENTIDQLDKSTVEKVIDDVSGRMINAYGDKKERLEEVQKAADEYVKGDKMDLNQDEISYDDDDDHDDH